MDDMPVRCTAFCSAGWQEVGCRVPCCCFDMLCSNNSLLSHPATHQRWLQVLATGRRRFFYVFDLGAGRIERVAGLFGREDRSLETFATAPGSDTAAFLLNGELRVYGGSMGGAPGERQSASKCLATPPSGHMPRLLLSLWRGALCCECGSMQSLRTALPGAIS